MKDFDLADIIEESKRILDENVNMLSDIEFDLNSEKEDLLTLLDKNEIVDMADEVAYSTRIKKAESSFVRRNLETGNSDLSQI